MDVRSRIIILMGVVGLQIGTGVLHVVLGTRDYVLSLYYANIIVSASSWGYAGGLTCATVSMGTLLLVSYRHAALSFSSHAVYILLFYLFAFIVGKLVKDRQAIHHLAVTDPLTGVFNRHFFIRQLTAETERYKRYGHPLSLLMVDVDNFKEYNDRFGHQRGDHVLAEIARVLGFNVRSVDTVYRYGGEEFAIILPEVGAVGAYVVAERLRKVVEDKVASSLKLTQPVTVSIGVAACHGGIAERTGTPEWEGSQWVGLGSPFRSTDAAEQLLERADQALYEAKREGRNCVRAWGVVPTPSSNVVSANREASRLDPHPSVAD